MTIATASGCVIEYQGNRIVLNGHDEAIHEEALKILRRFACSARPFRVREDCTHRVVLVATR